MGVRHQTKVAFQSGFIVIYQARTQKRRDCRFAGPPKSEFKKTQIL
jgi:hypothetical protein